MIDAAALIRALHFASTLLAAGCCCFLWAIAQPVFRRIGDAADDQAALQGWSLRIVGAALTVALISGALWLIATAASVSGRPFGAAMDPAVLSVVLTKTRFGLDWLLRLGICVVFLLLLAVAGVRAGRGLASIGTVLGAILVASLAWAGHGAADEGVGGRIHLAADLVHLLAAAAWLGSLPPLAYLLDRAASAPSARRLSIAAGATERFSVLGMIAVAALIGSGTANGWFLVGTIPALFGTAYGQVLLIKLALFLAIVGLATTNRFRHSPRLASLSDADRPGAARKLCRNACLEAGLGGGVLIAVGVLTLSVPAAHDAVSWPFPFTLKWSQLAGARTGALMLAGTTLVGIAALLGLSYGFRARRPRFIAASAAALGADLVLLCWSMAAPAYPTTYAASPDRFAAGPIAAGEPIYRDACAPCHGEAGYGDGPAAAALPTKPANLAAGHLLHHSDGEIFWWVTHGIDGTAMPGFGDQLSTAERWDVIAFLHAQADAEAAKTLTPSTERWRPIVAPDFAFQVGGGRQETLFGLRNRSAVLLVLYTLPGSAARLGQLSEARGRIEAAGARVIAIPMTGAGGEGPIFAAPDPGIAATYSLFRRLPAEASVPPTPPHLEFLIDRQGYLRARWSPDGGPGWDDEARLPGELDRLAREAPHDPAPLVAGHIH